MINHEKTKNLLGIDTSSLKKGSGVRVYWNCQSCGKERLKQYRNCLTSTGLCATCHAIKNGTMMGHKFGKAQQKTNKCLYCNTKIASTLKTCSVHRKAHLSAIKSGKGNPAWSGRNECGCGKKKSTGAKQCRSCSFASGSRSGKNNGRWHSDRAKIISSKIARSLLSNTLRHLGIKKNKKTTEALNYTFQELRDHLEAQFEPWMNWGNRGIGRGKWTIDHIVPVSAMIRMGVTDPAIINALWNLRPLDYIKNIKKSSRITPEAQGLIDKHVRDNYE